MSVTVRFECGGCFAKTEGTKWIGSEFISLTGRGYGFGHWKRDTVESVAPDGWVAFDPYTQCCYCPKCWEEIESGIAGDTE